MSAAAPAPRDTLADGPAVTVVIATAARPERAAALRRAIEGVLAQQPAPELVVVVNGSGFDAALDAELRADTRLRHDYQALGSYPAAQRRGRELVRTPCFCFLDDDDELLPGSIATRLARLQAADAPDVVVGAGVRAEPQGDRPYAERLPRDGEDAALELLRENWFASAAPLFRSATVGLEFFDGQTRHFEWTLLGFRLATQQRRFAFVHEPGFRIHESAVSLSKNPAGTLFSPELLARLLALTPVPALQHRLRQRLAAAHHACAELEWRSGHARSAWRHHLKSLALPGGWRYAPFTRHLLLRPTGTGH